MKVDSRCERITLHSSGSSTLPMKSFISSVEVTNESGICSAWVNVEQWLDNMRGAEPPRSGFR